MAIGTFVAELRQAREALASQFHYDLHSLIDNAKERQKTGGREAVSFPPIRLQPHNDE